MRLLLISLIHYGVMGYTLMVSYRIIASWFPKLNGYAVTNYVGRMTDPYLNIFRRVIPPIGGVVDFSPLLALFMLQSVGQLLMHLLLS